MSEIDWVHKDSTTIKEIKDIEVQTRVIDNSKDYIIERLQQENKQLKEKLDIILEDNNQLEEIRIKAIEYIKNHILPYYDESTHADFINLLEILGDKE